MWWRAFQSFLGRLQALAGMRRHGLVLLHFAVNIQLTRADCCSRGSFCIGDRMEVPMRQLLQDNSTADSSAGPSNELVEVG